MPPRSRTSAKPRSTTSVRSLNATWATPDSRRVRLFTTARRAAASPRPRTEPAAPRPAQEAVAPRLGNAGLPRSVVQRLQHLARVVALVSHHLGRRLGAGSRL